MKARPTQDATGVTPTAKATQLALAELRVAMAHRRMKDGDRIIARQRVLLERIRNSGGATLGAESLLFTMVSTQVQLRKALDQLKRIAENERRKAKR
jgi:hypothetical protein